MREKFVLLTPDGNVRVRQAEHAACISTLSLTVTSLTEFCHHVAQ